MTRNKPTSFYKYYSADSAIKTLKYTSRKWSSPIELNDPFDIQFDFTYGKTPKELEKIIKEHFIKSLLTNKPITNRPLPKKYRLLLEWIKTTPREILEQKLLPELMKSNDIYPKDFWDKQIIETNNQIKKALYDVSIFCLTETYDNLLMWTHYADNHTGAIIEFKDVPEKDTPIKLAKKVTYSEKMPCLDLYKLLKTNEPQDAYNLIHVPATTTKSIEWSYEKEWRIIGGLRNKSKTYEIISFAPEEVSNIYLGCKINEKDKKQIIQITREKYPSANIYQAYKNQHKFQLNFKEIK